MKKMNQMKEIFKKFSLVVCAVSLVCIACQSKTTEKPKEVQTTVDLEVLADNPGNPVITEKYTADPATLVHNDTVYLYAGHDEAPSGHGFYVLNEWLIYYSTDLKNWTEHPESLNVSEFKWASGDAWAAQVAEKDGKFYWYVTCTHATIPGKAIGVAVSDSPKGPFKDALGKALITNEMTTDVSIDWDDIDPTIFNDDDGQSYIFWGNSSLKYAKLKDNMIELDGDIEYISLPHFVEAPWVHKKGDWYYLTYSYKFPEKTAYAMSKSITGPWEFNGIINEVAGNCNTNHQAILEYKGRDYFIYHNGSIPTEGGSFRRSVCVDYLNYKEDGTIKKIRMTSEGIDVVE